MSARRPRVVVDASIVLAWYLDDEQSLKSERLLDALPKLALRAPSLWAVEAANALLLAARRKRISEQWAARSIEHCLRLPVALDILDANAVLRAARIAAVHSLTAYDACYVELAKRLRAPLATLDQVVVRTAPALKLKIWH